MNSKIVNQSNKPGNLIEPPRNTQHVYNVEKKIRDRTGIHKDDLHDVIKIMEFTDEKVVSDIKLGKKFRVIQKHDELIKHFGDVMKKSDFVVFGYDTTFSMGKYQDEEVWLDSIAIDF